MSPISMSRLESAVRLVVEFAEAFNRHDVEGMMALVSEDCVFESPGPAPDGGVCSGKEATKRYWQGFFRESPDAAIETEEVFGLGPRCVMRWRCAWVDAAGEQARVRGVDIYKVRNGLILERLSYVKG